MDRFCACAVPATATASNAIQRARNFMVSSYGLIWILPHAPIGMLHAKQAQSLRPALLRRILPLRKEAPPVTVHGDEERAEPFDAKLPQRFRVEKVSRQ